MQELISQFSFTEVVICIVAVLMAIKEGLELKDWFLSRGRNYYDQNNAVDKISNQLRELCIKYDNIIKEMDMMRRSNDEEIRKINDNISILVDSDKDDIKSFIVREYHYFVDEKKWIDDFSLDVIEKRFKHYREEGGNSYIEDLMQELRHLPKSPQSKKEE